MGDRGERPWGAGSRCWGRAVHERACPIPPTPAPPQRPLVRPQGAKPFFVCATCGTTVLGAFDPLDGIADICQRHGLWFHVDVSNRGRYLGLKGGHMHVPPWDPLFLPAPALTPLSLPGRQPGAAAPCSPANTGTS